MRGMIMPITGAKTKRFKHFRPEQGTDAYEDGQKQAKSNLECYHYVRALLLEKYSVVDSSDVESEASDVPLEHMLQKKCLDFSQYTDYELQSADEKIRLCDDGTVSPEDLKTCIDTIKAKHIVSDGGILSAVNDHRQAFFGIMINYNSSAKTTGDAGWDTFFDKLKAEGITQSDIKCLFFASDTGCLSGDCPFKHNTTITQTDAQREAVLEERRKYMLEPTPKQCMEDVVRRRNEYLDARNLRRSEKIPEELERKFWKTRARAFCARPECLKPWLLEDEVSPLKACSGCKWTYYCSVECQKKDWRRHKKEPCAPVEEIIRDDKLWSPVGTRKGTERVPIDWEDASEQSLGTLKALASKFDWEKN